MEILRKVGQFSLNKGIGMSDGLYNVTNDILLEHTEDEGVSYWFDEKVKDTLIYVSRNEFIARAKQMAGNDINKYIGKII
jgi:hypothetical protein